MQMRRGAIAAARGQTDLLPRLDLLPDDDGHAIFLYVKISRGLSIAVIDFNEVRRQGVRHRVHVKLSVVGFDHRSIEDRENGNADFLRGEVGYFSVDASMSVVSIIAPVVGENAEGCIHIDEVGREKIAKKIPPWG